MSKIGKKYKHSKESCKNWRWKFTITGPMGTKKLTINDKIFSSKLNDKNEFQILPLEKKVDKKTIIMWGTYRSLINNAILGVLKDMKKF